MFSTQRAEHTINLPCRSIAALSGDVEHHRFLVGTSILPTPSNRSPNEIHLLRFHEDMNELGTDFIFEHPTGEIVELNPYPDDAGLLLTCGTNSIQIQNEYQDFNHDKSRFNNFNFPSNTCNILPNKINLWKMPSFPNDDYSEDPTTSTVMEPRASPLEQSLSLPMSGTRTFHCSIWNDPDEKPLSLITLFSENGESNSGSTILSQWDLELGSPTEPIHEIFLPSTKTTKHKILLDPHNHNLVAHNHGSYILFYDLRSKSKSSYSSSAAFKVDTSHDIALETHSDSMSPDNYSQQGFRQRRHHRYKVTDFDFNPNRPHIVASGGEDALLKFWDTRATSSSTSWTTSTSYITSPIPSSFSSKRTNDLQQKSLKCPKDYLAYLQRIYPFDAYNRPIQICRGGHSHKITTVKYNPFHDQLILSSGSDSNVNLWRISSISSSPLIELAPTMDSHLQGMKGHEYMDNDDYANEEYEDDEFHRNHEHREIEDDVILDEDNKSSQDGPDVRVMKEEHQESVYDVAWSRCDAWVWASVGLDGGVSLNHVPSKEKYKILL